MRKLLLFFVLALSALFVLTGCGKQDASTAASKTKTVTYEGTQFTVPAQPQRIATLSNSLLYMVYELGGTAIARPVSTDKLPPAMEKVQTIGHTAHINMEALLKLKPDLVLGLATQSNVVPILKTNHIPHMMVSYDGIADNVPLLKALGVILNKQDKAKEEVEKYEHNIAKVKGSIAGVSPKTVAVLFASGRAITAETPLAITASMIDELGMTDVVSKHIADDQKTSKTIPYSLETLSMDDPDVIFIVTMGKRSDIDKQMKKSMTDNPAWRSLKAVKSNKVFYLPSDLFLLNPGLKTPQAMAELVEKAYGIKVPLD